MLATDTYRLKVVFTAPLLGSQPTYFRGGSGRGFFSPLLLALFCSARERV
jgi:hypothetical protein